MQVNARLHQYAGQRREVTALPSHPTVLCSTARLQWVCPWLWWSLVRSEFDTAVDQRCRVRYGSCYALDPPSGVTTLLRCEFANHRMCRCLQVVCIYVLLCMIVR